MDSRSEVFSDRIKLEKSSESQNQEVRQLKALQFALVSSLSVILLNRSLKIYSCQPVY